MKVLVTGVGGQLGRELVRSAPPRVDVNGLSRSELDITSQAAVEQCVRCVAPDVIINAAAYTAVDRAEQEPEQARLVNAVGPANLAAVAARIGARLVHISTDYVFDGTSDRPYTIDASTAPLNVYGRTKRDGENAVLEALPNAAMVVRTSWLYAEHGRNFVLTMLRLMNDRSTVRVVNDQTGTPTSAASLARAVWKLAERQDLSGIHHWTDDGTATWYDFATAIKEEGASLGLVRSNVEVTAIATRDFPTLAARPVYSVLDTRLSRKRLALEPAHWRSELRQVLEELARA